MPVGVSSDCYRYVFIAQLSCNKEATVMDTEAERYLR